MHSLSLELKLCIETTMSLRTFLYRICLKLCLIIEFNLDRINLRYNYLRLLATCRMSLYKFIQEIDSLLMLVVVDFRNLSHNFFDNMIPLSSGVLNHTTIDLSNNRFNNFSISSKSLPTLQLLYVYHAIVILDLTRSKHSFDITS